MPDKGFEREMGIIVISNYSVIREGIIGLITKQKNIEIKLTCETLKEAEFMIKSDTNSVVLMDINCDNIEELSSVSNIASSNPKVKFIIIDFHENKELFVEALKCGVKGYILGKSSEQEILYAISQVNRGKKYFDSYFVDLMVNKTKNYPEELELLTTREKEILIEVSKGISNKKIAEKFFITEHTVKKHVNHIFEKLNVNGRTEAAVYASKFGIVSK